MIDTVADEERAPVAARPDDMPALAFDLEQVTRLAAYPREQIFIVVAGGRRWSISPGDYYRILWTLAEDIGRTLRPLPAGREDTLWRVEEASA